jgi:hypothetical protein
MQYIDYSRFVNGNNRLCYVHVKIKTNETFDTLNIRNPQGEYCLYNNTTMELNIFLCELYGILAEYPIKTNLRRYI